MSTTRLPIFVIAMAVAFAGCTGAAPGAPTQDGRTPSPAEPTIAPSSVAPTDDDGDNGDTPHQVPDLEAMLPSVVLGVAVRKASLTGEQAIAELSLSDALVNAITVAGRSPSEIEAAIGAAEDDSFVISAIRVPGIDAQALRAAIVAANASDVLPVREGKIAGKDVISLGDSQFFYATGDILFSVLAEVNEANEIISGLP